MECISSASRYGTGGDAGRSMALVTTPGPGALEMNVSCDIPSFMES